jgi:integrase
MEYENWMREKHAGGNSATTGFYLRPLRAVINELKNKSLLPLSYQYPFVKHLYVIPNPKKVKQTLQKQEIEAIINLAEFDNDFQKRARDLWLFQFYCNGINIIDLIKLKWENRINNCFVIQREKTKGTSKSNPRPIKIPITSKLLELLEILGKKNSPYVLGILNDSMNEIQVLEKKSKFAHRINSHLKVISEKLNLSIELKTKTARDAYATTLKKNNVSIEKISEMLGHSNSVVTQHYLDNFEDEDIHSINSVLP